MRPSRPALANNMLLKGEKQVSVALPLWAPLKPTSNRSDSALHNDRAPLTVVVANSDFSNGENFTLVMAYGNNDAH